MQKTVEQFHLFRVRTFQDHRSFELLLADVGPRIQGLLRVKLPRLQDAQDAYSETALRLWAYVTQTNVDSFSAVAYTVARSVIADFYRTKGRRAQEAAIDDETADHMGSTKLEQETINAIDATFLKSLLERLSPEETQVILMRYIDQLSFKEIAEAIGKTENTTTVMARRAIAKLRSMATKGTL